MEKKQTAVEWFAIQLGISSGSMYEQALQMEKEQMCDFVSKYIDDAYFDVAGKRGFICTPEEYYNDIYENKNSNADPS